MSPEVSTVAGWDHAWERALDLAWERALDLAWERALDLAWDASCAGTTPVGAVVIDAAGAIVAEGRGRRYVPAVPPGQLVGTHVAHAELNALAQLGADRHRAPSHQPRSADPARLA